MKTEINQKRTMMFGLGIIRLVEALPEGQTAETIGGQLLRSGNTVGARYRAACNAFTKRERVGHLRAAYEKADETFYLLELLVEAKLVDVERIAPLLQEAGSMVQILKKETLEAVSEARGDVGE